MHSPSPSISSQNRPGASARNMLVLLVDGDLLRIFSKGKHNQQTAYTLPIPAHAPGDDGAQAFSNWFAEQVQTLKLRSRHACVVLTDPDVLHRYYELPGVSPREAAEVVNLKLSVDSPIPSDALQRDFVLYPESKHQPAAASVAITNGATLDKYRLACKQAGLRLQGITSAEWAFQSYLSTFGPRAPQYDVVVIQCNTKLQLLALKNGRLAKSYCHPCGNDADATGNPPLAAAVARFTAALQNADQSFELRRLLWVTRNPTAAWDKPLRELYPELACQTFATDAQHPAHAIALGCQSWVAASKAKKIDLAAPKTPPNSLATTLGLVAALLLVIGSFATLHYRDLWEQQASLNNQLSAMQSRLDALPETTPEQAQQVDLFKAVETLRANRVDWLAQIASLGEKLPDRREAFLTELQLLSPSKDTPAIISARGVASSQNDIMAMNENLAKNAGQSTLVPSSIQTSGRKDGFGYRFRLELRLSPEDASAAAAPEISRIQYASANP